MLTSTHWGGRPSQFKGDWLVASGPGGQCIQPVIEMIQWPDRPADDPMMTLVLGDPIPPDQVPEGAPRITIGEPIHIQVVRD